MEERAVALEGDAKVFSTDMIATVPLLFEMGAFFGEGFGEAADGGGYERIGILHRAARFVDEAGLNDVPAVPHLVGFIVGE